jgi:hypothetical protein
MAVSPEQSADAHRPGDLARDNDRLHDTFHRCVDGSPPDTA